jgi:hypothetical protein
MVFNLGKGSFSTTSNLNMSVESILEEFKEKETVHQLMKDMDLDKHASLLINLVQDEVISKHMFHYEIIVEMKLQANICFIMKYKQTYISL